MLFTIKPNLHHKIYWQLKLTLHEKTTPAIFTDYYGHSFIG